MYLKLISIMGFIRNFTKAFASEFRLAMHDQGILIFLVLLPIAYPIIYSLIYNPEFARDVAVVVVDNDRTQLSRELVRNIDACQEVHIIGYAADLNEAKRAMDSRDCFAIIEIPEGFQRKVERNETGNAIFYSDMSLMLRYKGVLTATTNVALAMGSELQAKKINEVAPLASTLTTGDPMPVESHFLGNIQGGFDSFLMPGVLILILQQAAVLAIGMAGGARREKLLYSEGNGMSITTWMLGRTACYLALFMVPAIYICHYVPLMFSFPMEGDSLQIFAFILPMLLASIMLGFCLQGVVTERETVFVIWVVTSIMFLFLSGLTWPRYAMTGVWKALADCVPATFGVLGFIKMNGNGSSLAQVGDCYTALWIQAAAYTCLAMIIQWHLRKHYSR